MGQLGYKQGDLGWSQLTTTDANAALDFYSKLVGWEKKDEPMPGYHVFGKGNEALGGFCNIRDGQATGWMPYITVENLDDTLSKVDECGGKILLPSTALPGDCGHVAIIQDPQGVATGLAQYKQPE